ncbi:MAG TPA: hypothetical protein VHB50_22900 [Bryobacteraceae bacterium]|nr:hypothetical protein [Bryobacteraceae bacterium]
MPLNANEVCREEAAQIAERQRKVLGAPGKPLLGVAFSGGGIRSATFNLGIVQGLAKSGLLPRVDYLSTVSGGGYIGTWLHGVIRRYGDGDPAKVKTLLTRPEEQPHEEPERDPIAFLRKYSSYLAPELGLFSADFWVIAGIWTRNILLNQLILLPFLAAVSLLTFFMGSLAGWYMSGHEDVDGEIYLTIVLLFALVWITGKGVGSVTLNGKGETGPASAWDSVSTANICSILILLASLGMAMAADSLVDANWVGARIPYIAMLLPRETHWIVAATIIGLVLSAMFLLLQWQGNFGQCFRNRHGGRPPWFGFWGYPLIAGITTGFLFFGVLKLLAPFSMSPEGTWNLVAWGPPLLALAIASGGAFHIGLMGVDYDDNAREWMARVGAYVGLFSFAWATLFTISVFGPYWLSQLAVYSWKPVAGLGGGWLLTSVAGALTGASTKTQGRPEAPPNGGLLRIIVKIAPTVFIAGYVLMISLGLHIAIAQIAGVYVPPQETHPGGPPAAVLGLAMQESKLLMIVNFTTEMRISLELLLSALIVVWYIPRRIDINEFSMHHFYKNRLVRCYLGATHGLRRRPSRFTGFDPCDDMPLAEFLATKEYFGPYPLINTCINLNRGSELAKRERRGSAFLFAPLYSGYDPPRSREDDTAQQQTQLHKDGYRPTAGYGFPEGYAIGTCMAMSGAAANPNGGYHTSGPMAFLMTLFNVRLGWWVGNSRCDAASARPGPKHALIALLSELFAVTDATSEFVNISDGGHFENLGLYELVRRRCRYIIVGDGEQDGDYTFESLGGAVRKCRMDFGVEIEIDPRSIRTRDGLSGAHYVVGRITYPPQSGQQVRETGWILYLKSSLTGDEPEDVAQYKSSHGDFPQEPTSNQFFTESQFESYRKLGRHVWDTATDAVKTELEAGDLEKLFDGLRGHQAAVA